MFLEIFQAVILVALGIAIWKAGTGLKNKQKGSSNI